MDASVGREFAWGCLMKKNYGEMFLIALFTAVIGQIHFYPFGTDFRLTLGVVVFTFLILYFRVPIIATAALSTVFILGLRVGLDVAGGLYPAGDSLIRHMPAMLFYLTYGLIIDQIDIRAYIQKPVNFIVIVSIADICSNFLELLVRNNLRSYPLESVMTMIIMAALIRAVLVLVLFWAIRYYNLVIVKEVHQKRYQELLMLTARLNSEILFLRKSMQDIEDVMVKSYGIYTHSKEISAGNTESLKTITDDSLSLAIDIHEIKKDYLRIVHSIGKIIPEEGLSPSMTIKEILRTIQDIYHGYAESTGKSVRLKFNMRGDVKISRYYEVISILNNLIHNALDATDEQPDPTVMITAELAGDYLVIQVEDNGHGIAHQDRDLIFEPGFTTKMDMDTGELPTGLGLTHVRILTNLLGGTVELEEGIGTGAAFILRLPLKNLTFQEDAVC